MEKNFKVGNYIISPTDSVQMVFEETGWKKVGAFYRDYVGRSLFVSGYGKK